MKTVDSNICVIGDTHGHLQLALCIAARWQREEKLTFDAVFLCGDVGTFTHDRQLDSTTRRHAKSNPGELEFLYQWSRNPQPEWLSRIFTPIEKNGLGLLCPVIMVHGNHEGFEHLAAIVPAGIPSAPAGIDDLPGVDSQGFIKYLPSGWTVRLSGGVLAGGVGGIEHGQRTADYQKLAYLTDEAILSLLEGPSLDLLVTHQGPASTQGSKGSSQLQLLLDAEKSRVWCHGHSITDKQIRRTGKTTIVPLGDVAFTVKGPAAGDPGKDGWCILQFGDTIYTKRARPEFWRDYRLRKWVSDKNGLLICPDLKI
ncbi:metallophosphoesterase [candidate division KSB1 bacterium]|nr:metallophosphoesterase [candidate division KSB1 bacterium]